MERLQIYPSVPAREAFTGCSPFVDLRRWQELRDPLTARAASVLQDTIAMTLETGGECEYPLSSR